MILSGVLHYFLSNLRFQAQHYAEGTENAEFAEASERVSAGDGSRGSVAEERGECFRIRAGRMAGSLDAH
jgi:hypothetical protein